LLFKPGTYQVDLKIGYYTHIMGLGESPDDVIINGSLISKGEKNGNVTCNFWRSVENLTIVSPAGAVNIWGVSQAAPMRRVHIKGDIQLHDNGWASGGFLADSKIDGTVFFRRSATMVYPKYRFRKMAGRLMEYDVCWCSQCSC